METDGKFGVHKNRAPYEGTIKKKKKENHFRLVQKSKVRVGDGVVVEVRFIAEGGRCRKTGKLHTSNRTS